MSEENSVLPQEVSGKQLRVQLVQFSGLFMNCGGKNTAPAHDGYDVHRLQHAASSSTMTPSAKHGYKICQWWRTRIVAFNAAYSPTDEEQDPTLDIGHTQFDI